MYLIKVDRKGISQVFLPQLGVPRVLYGSSGISRNKPVRTSTRDKHDVCPGYNSSGDAPVGCFVIKGDEITVGVVHQ
jgi:hypothetical protein